MCSTSFDVDHLCRELKEIKEGNVVDRVLEVPKALKHIRVLVFSPTQRQNDAVAAASAARARASLPHEGGHGSEAAQD